MQTVILAGGRGTRLSEETSVRPKPMVEIGGRPILQHIMEIYDAHGHRDFVIALGHLGQMIKRYFIDWTTLAGDLSIDLGSGEVRRNGRPHVDWKVLLVETGSETETGGRLKRAESHLARETFMLTYGDGVSDVNVNALVDFHRSHGRIATVTGVHPPARFGVMDIDEDRVRYFAEKPQLGQGWINGGFMVFEPRVFDYIAGDDTVLERDVLSRLSNEGELMVFRHEGFWQCMDTLRDVRTLTAMCEKGSAPWQTRRA
jgi:glucose-1-phosphate cytidylyltransferase